MKSVEIRERRHPLEEVMRWMPLREQCLVWQYLQGKLTNPIEYERIDNIHAAVIKEKSHWWNSDYPQERAYNQFFCNTLIINYDIYRQDIKRLLKRNVSDYEIITRESIIDEVKERYAEWKSEFIAEN